MMRSIRYRVQICESCLASCSEVARKEAASKGKEVEIVNEDNLVYKALFGSMGSPINPAVSSWISLKEPAIKSEVYLDYEYELTESFIQTLLDNEPEDVLEGTIKVNRSSLKEALDSLMALNDEGRDLVSIGGHETVSCIELNSVITPFYEGDPDGVEISIEEMLPNHNGFVTVSQIGYNEDRTVAVLYFFWTLGPSTGWGAIHVLQKINGVWGNAQRWRQFGWTS